MTKIFQDYGDNPVALFGEWFALAEQSEPHDPNAMALASVDAHGRPSVRIVLMKGFDARGFTFFTNYESRKGCDLMGNPHAELNFYWKSLRRQVRIAGVVEQTSAPEADDYFATRSRASQIGAWASSQSRVMGSYEDLTLRFAGLETEFANRTVPKPPHWGGFRLKPERMEFWIAHRDRLHTRFVYTRAGAGESDDAAAGTGWRAEWLFP